MFCKDISISKKLQPEFNFSDTSFKVKTDILIVLVHLFMTHDKSCMGKAWIDFTSTAIIIQKET